MKMTIEESFEWLIPRKEHYEMDDNCQELAQALELAIYTMHKYQKIKEIVKQKDYKDYDRFNTHNYYGDFLRVQDIRKVIQYGNVD